jgi:hypothetical protein
MEQNSSIYSFYFPQLPYGVDASFHNDTIVQLEKVDPITSKMPEQLKKYILAYDDLKATIDVFSRSKLSKESTEYDKRRVKLYSAFKAYVKVYLNDENEEKVIAAEKIMDVIRLTELEIGKITVIGMAKTTTATLSLLRNLESLETEIRQIDAEDRLMRLTVANQEFVDLQFERYMETATKHSGDVKSARLIVDEAYSQIMNRINAHILLEGDEEYTPYVKAQNAIIERYKNIVAIRKGKAIAKKNEYDEKD